MGKRTIPQARGKGGPAYRVRKRAYRFKIGYPRGEGEATIKKIFHSSAHSAPLMKLEFGKKIFYLPAFNMSQEGQKISIGGKPNVGNILPLKKIPTGTKIYNIEIRPGDGGKMIRTAGSFALLVKKNLNNKFSVLMPNKKEKILSGNSRATIGVIAGDGIKLKPFIKAGKKYYKMKSKSKLWPRTSALKMNAVDHPFGSGRGKVVKSKIVRRNAPRGRRVGHLKPRRTGRKK